MELQYLVREPEHISAETPILFLIHGYGSNEEDLFSFTPTLPKDWLIVSFRAPNNVQFGGYSWYDIDFLDSEKFINTAQAFESLNHILNNIIEIKQRYGLNENTPTHLCGFSQGGILSYALALKNPQLFSKIACLS
ncbi:MAG: alpha/beta hydrolase-fold protein, partial [Bergeyella zoohelcum]|nr:alpha/beta hydrolase-fold protein [Bergeyella zoohelcum]